MYNSENFNKALNYMKDYMFEQAFSIFVEMLSNNLTNSQRFNIYFEMSMCKAELEEYSEAEEYIIECIKIDERPMAYELLEAIYEMEAYLPNNLEFAQKAYNMYKDPYLGIKLIYLYNEQNLYDKITQIEIIPDYLKDINLCNCLYTAYFNEYKLDIASKFYEYMISEINNKELSNAEDKELIINSIKTMFQLSIYDTIEDEQFTKLMNICYNNTEHNDNKVESTGGLWRDLKIGIISSDFYLHPVGFFVVALLENSNDSIKYHAYYTDDIKDSLNETIISNVDKFYNVKELTDEQLEQFILDDKLDILIDLNGNSDHNKHNIIKNRLAPVQMSWIGWPMTTSLPNMDYIIVDKHTAPQGAEKYYTEKLIRMNNTTLCYPVDINFDKHEPPFLKNGYITFGSFNNPLKYSKVTLSCYAKVLEKLPNSKILIISSGVEGDNKEAFFNLFLQFNIPFERLIFKKVLSFTKYLQNYNEVDIILDTYPFNGATTTGDTLCFGVPIISLYGKHHVSRVGFSMLNAARLSDLAVGTIEEYVEKAVELANDKERLISIHKNLRITTKESVLKNKKLFSREIETRFRYAYINYCIAKNKTNKDNNKPINKLKDELTNAISFIEDAIEFFYDDYDKITDINMKGIKDEINSLLLNYYKLLSSKEPAWLDSFNEKILDVSGTIGLNDLLIKLKNIKNKYLSI